MKTKELLRSAAFSLAALLTVSAAAVSVSAVEEAVDTNSEPEYESLTCGEYNYHILVNSEDETERACCLDRYAGMEPELEIPDEIDGFPVVMIGEYAFTSSHFLHKVTLPKTVQSLGQYAFAECTGMEYFEVEEGNEFFESRDGILYSTDGRTLVRYPIGREDTSFTVPDGIVMIDNVAFACSILTEINFPESLEAIRVSAFSMSNGLTSVKLPNSVELVDAFAFNSCAGLEKIELSSSLKEIGNAAFSATALKEIDLPEGLLSIGQQAFAATPLKEVTIPASVTTIDFCAFGWQRSQSGEMYADSDFVIRGVAGSVADSYANDTSEGNNFQFIATNTLSAPQKDSEADHAEAETTPQQPEKEGLSSGRIIGIAVCGVLLVVIAVVAIVTGKKKKGASEEDA